MAPEPIYIRANYKGSEKLQNKVALITGGDSGIGRAVTVHFAREGADVALSYKPEEQADADDTRALMEAEGRRCVLLPGDLRSPEYCESLVAQTVQQLGKLNSVVSNAAEQFVRTDVAELPHAQFGDTFQVNFFALVRVVKAALPHLHVGDSIIATSSINAYRGQLAAGRLYLDQGRDYGLHPLCFAAARREADTGQHGSAWPHLDAAHPRQLPARQGGRVWARHHLEAPQLARRSSACLRVSGLRRCFVHHGPGHPPQRR